MCANVRAKLLSRKMFASTRSLEQIKEECLSNARNASLTEVGTGELFRWKGTVATFVKGELEFRFSPNFGAVLFDSSGYIPCLLVDPVRNVTKILELCNHKVMIRHPEFVVELFVANSQEKSLVHLLLNVQKVELDEVLSPREEEESSASVVADFDKDSSIVLDDSVEPSLAASWNQKIVPLKISSNFQAPNSDVVCFVLVALVSEENTEKEELVWLLLTNENVAWKDLLVPYRVYNICVPSEVPTDYFGRRRSLFSFFDRWDRTFLHMVHHHKDLMKTNLLVHFPKSSKISALNEHRPTDHLEEKWLRISDPCLKCMNFASICGIVKEIRYMAAWKSQTCSWCRKFENVFEEFIQDHDRDETTSSDDDVSDEVKNEWCSPECGVENPADRGGVAHHFPQVRLDEDEHTRIKGFGIRGGDTIRITLKKPYSDRVAYVFLKRWQSQYPAGLAEGVTVCFTDVNVQRTKKKYFYFISTPLTRIIHLEETGSKMHLVVQNWGEFCFPFVRGVSGRFWGTLDLDLLTKVSISARCKLCDKPFLQYRCTDVFCSNSQLRINADFVVKAVARLFVRGFEGCVSNSLYLKNENVQKYLCLPDRIWQKLQHLSANSELFYLCSSAEIDETNCDIANIYFQKYCKYFRPRPRFHVLCKPFKDDENSFFCLDLVEVNDSRTNALRAAIEKKSKGRGEETTAGSTCERTDVEVNAK